MAFAVDAASTRQFNDRDKGLVKAFPKFAGAPGDDVDDWWRAFTTLDQQVWWPVPPAGGGGNLASAPLAAAQNETRTVFIRQKLIGEAERWWDNMPVNDPVTGVAWTFPARMTAFREHF